MASIKGTNMEHILKVFNHLDNASAKIMESKNHDYRGGNDDPFYNFVQSMHIGIQPEVGLCLRMMDKHQRIRTFMAKGMLKVKGESVADAVLDCFNYTILLFSMLRQATCYQTLMAHRGSLTAASKFRLKQHDFNASLTESDLLALVELDMKQRKFHCEHWLVYYSQLGELLEVGE